MILNARRRFKASQQFRIFLNSSSHGWGWIFLIFTIHIVQFLDKTFSDIYSI